MTVLEVWLKTMVGVATRGLETHEDDTLYFGGNVEVYVDLEQRVAILLIQARALECRQLAGELNVMGDPGAMAIARRCMDRSHKLETLGLQYAKEWPPAGWYEAGKVLM